MVRLVWVSHVCMYHHMHLTPALTFWLKARVRAPLCGVQNSSVLVVMSLRLLAPSTLHLVEAFLYDAEGAITLRLLGRVGIVLADRFIVTKTSGFCIRWRHPFLEKARLAYEDLWQRRDELEAEHEPGGVPVDEAGYWTDRSYESCSSCS